MSKIGNYVLERQENEYDNRYRNNFQDGSHLVLWDTDGSRETSAHTSKLYAVARAYQEYAIYCWTQHYILRRSQDSYAMGSYS